MIYSTPQTFLLKTILKDDLCRSIINVSVSPKVAFLLWTRNRNSINDLAKVTVLRHDMAIYAICTLYNEIRLGQEISFIIILTFTGKASSFTSMSW